MDGAAAMGTAATADGRAAARNRCRARATWASGQGWGRAGVGRLVEPDVGPRRRRVRRPKPAAARPTGLLTSSGPARAATTCSRRASRRASSRSAGGERCPNERGSGAGGRGAVGRDERGRGDRPAAGDRRGGAGGGGEVHGVHSRGGSRTGGRGRCTGEPWGSFSGGCEARGLRLGDCLAAPCGRPSGPTRDRCRP